MNCPACNATQDNLSDVLRTANNGVLDSLAIDCAACKHREYYSGEDARRVDAILHPAATPTPTEPRETE